MDTNTTTIKYTVEKGSYFIKIFFLSFLPTLYLFSTGNKPVLMNIYTKVVMYKTLLPIRQNLR